MGIAGEENDAATAGREATEEVEHEGSMGDVVDLERLLEAVGCGLQRRSQVPIECIADDAFERGQLSAGDFIGQRLCEAVDFGEACQIELADGDLGTLELVDGSFQGGGVCILARGITHR